LIEEYSDRQLSYSSDKLRAISGVARYLRLPELGSYHAGFWAVELPLALLWFYLSNVDPEDSEQKAQPYRAPSWSWTSVDGRTRFAEIKGDHHYLLASVQDPVTIGHAYIDRLTYPWDGIKVCSGNNGDSENPQQGIWLDHYHEKDLPKVKFPY
jgi:hypothetical protein